MNTKHENKNRKLTATTTLPARTCGTSGIRKPATCNLQPATPAGQQPATCGAHAQDASVPPPVPKKRRGPIFDRRTTWDRLSKIDTWIRSGTYSVLIDCCATAPDSFHLNAELHRQLGALKVGLDVAFYRSQESPNQQGGANGRQPLRSVRVRKSAAAASRRSP